MWVTDRFGVRQWCVDMLYPAKLEEYLVNAGLLSEEQFEKAKQVAHKKDISLDKALISLKGRFRQ